jgi:ribosomal protein S18 acetylase RimI-like enzyme
MAMFGREAGGRHDHRQRQDGPAVNVSDWHTIPAAEMQPVYHAEEIRWRECLSWETAATWDVLEQSRRRGLVSGFITRGGDGRICGWVFHLRHRDTLQIGGLTSSSQLVTRDLVAAVLGSSDAQRTSRAVAFTLAGAPGLESCLQGHGFGVGTYRYLQRALDLDADYAPADRSATRAHLLRAWRREDAAAVTKLLRAAYADADPLRPFGGDGTSEDWREYLAQLTTETGCGRFCGRRSLIALSAQGEIDGAALVTDLGGGTAHLAHLVVAPSVQGAGLGRRLLGEAMTDACRGGFARMTLLVSERNSIAQRLYARLGFAERAVFVTAAN